MAGRYDLGSATGGFAAMGAPLQGLQRGASNWPAQDAGIAHKKSRFTRAARRGGQLPFS